MRIMLATRQEGSIIMFAPDLPLKLAAASIRLTGHMVETQLRIVGIVTEAGLRASPLASLFKVTQSPTGQAAPPARPRAARPAVKPAARKTAPAKPAAKPHKEVVPAPGPWASTSRRPPR